MPAKKPIMQKIEDFYVVDASDEDIKLAKARGAFAEAYCVEKGWDFYKLSVEQVVEIRSQPRWLEPEFKRAKG